MIKRSHFNVASPLSLPTNWAVMMKMMVMMMAVTSTLLCAWQKITSIILHIEQSTCRIYHALSCLCLPEGSSFLRAHFHVLFNLFLLQPSHNVLCVFCCFTHSTRVSNIAERWAKHSFCPQSIQSWVRNYLCKQIITELCGVQPFCLLEVRKAFLRRQKVSGTWISKIFTQIECKGRLFKMERSMYIKG